MRKNNLFVLLLFLVCYSATGQIIEDFDQNRLTWAESPEAGLWQIGSPTSGPMSDFDNENLLATNLAGPYKTDKIVSITSSLFTVPEPAEADGSVFLDLVHWYDVYSGAYIYIIVTPESGENPKTLKQYYDYSLYEKRWLKESLDISDYAGQKVSLKFKISPGTRSVNTTSPGWYIDHIGFHTSEQEYFEPLTFTPIQNTGIPKDSAYTQEIKLASNDDGIVPEFLFESSDLDLVPLDSISMTTEDNLTYNLRVSPVAGTTGFSKITVATQNGTAITNKSFMVYVYEPYAVFEDDFENTIAEEWENAPARNYLWQIGEVKTGPQSGYNSERAMGTNLISGYSTQHSIEASFISRPITLPVLEMGTYNLKLKQWRDLSSCCGDNAVVLIQTESGKRVELYRKRYYDGKKWEDLNFSLDQFEGETIRIEFMLDIYGSSHNYGRMPGWIIDNVKIEACAEQPVTVTMPPFIRPVKDQYLMEADSTKVAVYIIDDNPENLSVTINSYNTDVVADESITAFSEYPKWIIDISNVKDGEAIIELVADNGEKYASRAFKIVKAQAENADSVALMSFYNELTKGSDRLNWKDSPMNQWDGVELNDQGRVSQLNLSSYGLGGIMVPALGRLDSLQVLDLSSNYGIKSRIPAELFNLPKLEILDLSGTAIFGIVPAEIGNLQTLTELYLNNTGIYGDLPVEIGQLKNLRILNMESCEDLQLSDNSVLYGLESLEYLNMNRVPMANTLPEGISNLKNLRELYIGSCRLIGSLPDDIGELKYLKTLNVSSNTIRKLPASFGNLDSLTSAYFQSCYIDSLPETFGNLASLKILNLSSNTGLENIPAILGNIDSLQALDLTWNKFKGGLPKELANLKELTSLNLSGNNLTGAVPEEFSKLEKLTSFNINNTNLSSLPVIAEANNKSLSIYAQNCQLQFDDMERNRHIYRYYFSNQKTIGEKTFISADLGTDTVLRAEIRGQYNRYQWYKDEELLEEDTLAELKLEAIADSMAGVYQCLVTNDSIAGITLQSTPYALTINQNGNSAPVFNAHQFTFIERSFQTTRILEATDADGDEITYELLTNTYGEEFKMSGPNRIYMRFYNSSYKPSVDLIVAAKDGKGGVDTAVVTINFSNSEVDTKQAYYSYPTFEIKENTPPGTSIGFLPQLEIDTVGLFHYISSGGTDLIALDSATREITLIGEIDYEVLTDFSFTFMASNDKEDVAYWYTDFKVIDDESEILNLAPVAEDQSFSLKEGSTQNYEIGQLVARDADGDQLSFYLAEPSAVFEVNIETGVISLIDSSAIDFETTDTYTLQAKTSDLRGGTDEFTISITIEDINELLVSDMEFSIGEFAPNGSKLGKIDATHLENASLSFEIIPSGQTVPFRFSTVDPTMLLVLKSDMLNMELTDAYTFDVAIASSKGEKDTISVTAKITERVEEISAEDQTFELKEFTPNDSVVYSVIASEKYDAVLSFSIINDTVGVPFVFTDSLSGNLAVADSAKLNIELTDAYRFSVLIQTKSGIKDTITVTAELLEEADLIIAENQTLAVQEHAPQNSLIGTVLAHEKHGETVSFELIEQTEALPVVFADSLSGKVLLADSAFFNYDSVKTLVLEVALATKSGAADTILLTIEITPGLQEIVAEDQQFSIAEFTPENTAVGTIEASEKYGASIDLEIIQEAVPFYLQGNELLVADSSALNYEADSVIAFNIELSTERGTKDTVEVAVKLLPLQHEITAEDQTFSIVENDTAGTVVGTIPAHEKYGFPIAMSVLTENVPFAFNQNNELVVLAAPALNYDLTPEYNLSVELETRMQVKDTITVTVSLSALQQEITAEDQSFTVTAGNTLNLFIGMVVAHEKNGADLHYAIDTLNNDIPFTINEISGALYATDSALLDTAGTYSFSVIAKTLRDSVKSIGITVTVLPKDSVQQAGVSVAQIAGTETLQVIVTDTTDSTHIIIYNNWGNEVYSTSFNTDTLLIYVTGFETNVYTGVAKTDKGKYIFNVSIISNDTPEIVASDTVFSITEFSPNGTEVGLIDAFEQTGSKLTFSIIDSLIPFAFVDSTAQLIVADSAALNFDQVQRFDFTVKLESDNGLIDTISIGVDIKQAVQKIIAYDQAFFIQQSDTMSDYVGTVKAYEINGADLYYAIDTLNSYLPFTIDEISGALYATDSALLDTAGIYTFSVLAKTLRDSVKSIGITVTVLPKDSVEQAGVSVSQIAGTETLQVIVTDTTDSTHIIIYNNWGNEVYSTSFNTDTLLIDVTGFETNVYTGVAKTDKKEYLFNVSITAINTPAIIASDTVFSITEFSPHGTVVGVIDAFEQTGSKLTFSIIDSLIPFAFVDSTAQLIVADSAALNYDLVQRFDFTVKLESDNGLIDTISVAVDIKQAVQKIIASNQAFVIQKSDTMSDYVGTVKAYEQNGADISYAIIGNLASIPFSVDKESGELYLTNIIILENEPTKTVSFQMLLETERGLKEIIDIIVALNEQTATDSTWVKVSPNPIVDTMTVEVHGQTQRINISLQNTSGDIIFKTPSRDSIKHIDVSAFEPGLYTVIVETDFDTTSLHIALETTPETIIAEDQYFSLSKANASNGNMVGTVNAYEKYGAKLQFSIAGDTTSIPFSIDATTGELFIKNKTILNFTKNTSYLLTILLETANGTIGAIDVIVETQKSESVAVEEEMLSSRVYPTIAEYNISVEINKPSSVQIFTTDGKLVYSGKLTDKTNGINVSELSSGRYFIRLKNNEETVMHTFIKR